MKILPIIVCFIFLICSSTSQADSTLSIISEQGQSTILVKNGRIMMRSNDPDNAATVQNRTISEAIFDTTQETLYVIDHEQQTVSPLTRESLQQLGETLSAAAGVLDSIPDEQRESLSDFMQGLGLNLPEKQATPQVQLNPLQAQEFRGMRCQQQQVVEDGQEIGQICITQGNSTPLTDEDYQTLLSAQTFFLSMAKHATPFVEQYGQSMPNLDGINIDGLVVNSSQTQNTGDGQNTSFSVSKIDTDALQEINLPAGYAIEPLF